MSEANAGTLIQAALAAFFGAMLLLLVFRGYRNPSLLLAGTMVIVACGMALKFALRTIGS